MASFTVRSNTRRIPTAALFALLISPAIVGCGGTSQPTTGGDTEVTTTRLQGANLSYIANRDLVWKFDDTTVTLTNNDKAIPTEILAEILGADTGPKSISASWELANNNTRLRLFDMTVDGEKSEASVIMPIDPAGHVRIDLGSFQYNVKSGR